MDSSSQTEAFIQQLDEKQLLALNIAKDHLGSSFDITKCNGFKDYISSQK